MEYIYMTEAFSLYGAPDLRQEAIDEVARKLKWIERTPANLPYSGFYEADNGKWYSYHFWFYSLLATPIKMLLEVIYIDPYRCFAILNCLLFLALIYHLYKYLNLEKERKILFIGLVVINPVVWYLQWPHTEVYSYILVLYSILLFHNNKLALSILASSLAAIQNPPIIIIGLGIGIFSIFKNFKTKEYFNIFKCFVSGFPALLPAIFYYINYGTPNLIVKTGFASSENVSILRFYDMFFDLNIGLLAYIPLVLIIYLLLILKSIPRLNIKILVILSIIIGMMILSAQTSNWNHGCDGINRYLVWMMPLIFYTIIFFNIRTIIIYSIIYSQVIVIFLYGWPDCNVSYLKLTPLSKVILNNVPALYNPDPAIFVKRSLEQDVYIHGSSLMPFIYSYNKIPKKIYTDYNGLLRLKNHCEIIDTDWYNKKLLEFKNKGNGYINPPPNSIKLYDIDIRILTPRESSASINLVNTVTKTTPGAFFNPRVNIKNMGTATWFTDYFEGGGFGIFISYHWFDESGTKIIVKDGIRTKFPYPLRSGEEVELQLTVKAPDVQGEYILAIDIVQEHVRWFSDLGNPMLKIPITVTSEQQRSQ